MNFIKFATGTTNIFPLANSHSGGQLLSEWNLRSRESVACGPASSDKRLSYSIGPSYVNSEEDFKVTGLGSILTISSGRALINGHFFESLVDVTVDMAEANNNLIKRQIGTLKGSLTVGLKAMYSTEATLAGTMTVENEEHFYEGVQVVVLPSSEFKLPEDSPEDPAGATAHIKLATFYYSNGSIQSKSIVNNYPAKCQIMSADRIANVDNLLSDMYVNKTGLQPGALYTFSGKGNTNQDTWCNSVDSLMVWDSSPRLTTKKPAEHQAEFGVKGSGEVVLQVPHKQVDGFSNTNGNPQYYQSRTITMPMADYESGTSGTVSKAYTQSIKNIGEKINNFYHLTSGKQRGYVDAISDTERTELPAINQSVWAAGDYILVGTDNSVVEAITTSLIKQPSTLYVVLPPLVTKVEFVSTNNDGSIPSSLKGVQIHKFVLSYKSNDPVPNIDNSEVYNNELKVASGNYHGDQNKDYILVEYTDLNPETKKEYVTYYFYKVVATSGKKVYSDPILLTGQTNLATESMIGGFLNVPDTALDAGYVYRDSDGHLRILDYALLRSGTLAYQLDSDKQYGPNLTNAGIQEQLDEYVNNRVAFKADNTDNVINITLDLDKEDEASEIVLQNIDSRFGAWVYLHITGEATHTTTLTIKNCQKLRIDNSTLKTEESKSAKPVINLINSCLYYDSIVIENLNKIENMTLWYERFDSSDPNIVVDGMKVIDLDVPAVSYDLDYWSPDVPNDNHYMYSLQSVTFTGNGTIIGAGMYIKNNTTANVAFGPSIIASQFSLPQGVGLAYPKSSLASPIKISGSFVTAYPQPDTLEYRVIKTHFTALSQKYNYATTESEPGTISILAEASSIGGVVGIDPTKEIDGWAPTSFHVFEGMVIG